MTDKKTLRHTLLAVRASIGQAERAMLDSALCQAIAGHPYFAMADALLIYLPMRGEPDLTPLLDLANERHVPVYLPRCTGQDMRFLLYSGQGSLTQDRFGILAPHESAEMACPTENTLCILPGLSADKHGVRLGYGGGFYDRFLPHFEGNVLFPIYEKLLCDTLPREATDFLLDPNDIITEKGMPPC